MPFNTLSVATAVTPSIIETYFSHYLHKKSLRSKPTAHISYHEGLRLVREFLDYASRHTVEELQAFTAQWVPAPTWVRTKDVEIAPQFILRAANIINAHLGPKGVERVGGKTWWQWRRPETPLRAEWIGMKRDDVERQKLGTKCDRVILYTHGGAYFFGSVDEHRYQMQRHARKLKARLLAPRYRLAPQFPFPCGLHDCIATYFYLLEHFPPEQIIFMGDSAGAGMTLAMLVILRDQGLPLPAGTVLLSPWVDLTHSFPSVAGNGELDYIPPHGFLHRPSMAWPPAPFEEVEKSEIEMEKEFPTNAIELPAISASPVLQDQKSKDDVEKAVETHDKSDLIPGIGSDNLRIELDGQMVELTDQIQLYTTNQLLSHPLVSPVLQPSLGGLPPMLIQVGGGELLKDEQIYLAHKAANPPDYPPSAAILDEYDPKREMLNQYPPTYVQLQVWDDLCHVPHTLSFTTPAKFMYRSVAQFGAWALARSQRKGIDIPNDDAISITSTAYSGSIAAEGEKEDGEGQQTVGRAGDPVPPFVNHMIRQRVDRHGKIYSLPTEAELPGLHLEPASIGCIKPGPVRKWVTAKKMHERRFAKDKARIDARREREFGLGYDVIAGETPPPTALAGRRRNGTAPEEQKKSKRSWGLSLWSGWGSKHDEDAIREEKKIESEVGEGVDHAAPVEHVGRPSSIGNNSTLTVPHSVVRRRRATSAASKRSRAQSQASKGLPRSTYRQIIDEGQAGEYPGSVTGLPPASFDRRPSNATSLFESRPVSANAPISAMYAEGAAPTTTIIAPDSAPVPGAENTYLNPNSQRPHNGVAAYPFKLRKQSPNPSTLTLDSQFFPEGGTVTPIPLQPTDAVELPTPADEKPSKFNPSSPLASARAVSPTVSEHTQRPSLDTPVSPIEPATPATFQSSTPVFNQRTSVIGQIGADGMPFAIMSHRNSRISDSSAADINHATASEFVTRDNERANPNSRELHEAIVDLNDDQQLPAPRRPPLETFVTAPEPDDLLREK